MTTKTENNLPEATKWELYTFDDLAEEAFESDEITITNEKELLIYLKDRSDNYVRIRIDGLYDVLFA